MTQDPSIVLNGLLCCSKKKSDCDNCPFFNNCRELEVDASAIIQSLVERCNHLESLVDELSNDIDTKLKYIIELEEMVGMPRE